MLDFRKREPVRLSLIHILTNSADHINYIHFRDYMNGTPSAAKEYERLKIALAQKASAEDGRKMYLAGKHDFIVRMLAKALAHSYLGKTVEIRIDRPLGSTHPSHPDLVYPIDVYKRQEKHAAGRGYRLRGQDH